MGSVGEGGRSGGVGRSGWSAGGSVREGLDQESWSGEIQSGVGWGVGLGQVGPGSVGHLSWIFDLPKNKG